VDFGLVRDLVDTSLTQTWLMRGPGTPFFAPPEQLRNEKAMIDWRADQFSLGVVMALSVFGFHQYQDDGVQPQQTVDRVAERSAQSDRFLNAAAQARMHFLIRMTAPWPVERYRVPVELEQAWRSAGQQ
jgi:serine/threonine protein kinase